MFRAIWAPEHLVGWVAVLVLLGPLATASLPFRASLMAQGFLVFAPVFVLALRAAFGRRWRAVARAPRSLLVACCLFAAATLLGLVVALARGNQPLLMVGQTLSMGLLPLAALAALARPWQRWEAYSLGLALALLVGAALLVAAVALREPGVQPTDWRFGNAISIGGSGLIALFPSLALWRRGSRGVSWLALAGAVAAGWAVSVSSSRSLLVAAGLAAVLWVFIAFGMRIVSARVLAGVGLSLALAATVVLAWWARWALHPVDLEPVAGREGVTGSAVVLPAGTFRLTGEVSCDGRCDVSVVIRHVGTGGLLRYFGVRVPEEGRLPFDVLFYSSQRGEVVTFPVPEAGRPCTLGVTALERVLPDYAGRLLVTLVGKLSRPPDPAQVGGLGFSDASLAFRLRESRAVLEEMGDASVGALLFGHGLGATVPLHTRGYDSLGQVVAYEEVNYLHNYYLFLAYKLGIVGGLAVLAALLLVVGATARAVGAHAPGSPERLFLAGALAVWVAFLARSLVAPTILAPRVAPIWGLLVAVTGAMMRPGAGDEEPGEADCVG